MTETECQKFTVQYVDSEFASKLSVCYSLLDAHDSLASNPPQIWKDSEHIDNVTVPTVKDEVNEILEINDRKRRNRKKHAKRNGKVISENVAPEIPKELCEESAKIQLPLKFTSFVGKNLLSLHDANMKVSISLKWNLFLYVHVRCALLV